MFERDRYRRESWTGPCRWTFILAIVARLGESPLWDDANDYFWWVDAIGQRDPHRPAYNLPGPTSPPISRVGR